MVTTHMATIIGIVGRLVHHREDLARACIQDHHRSRAGTVQVHRGFQAPIGQVLQAQVNTQAQIPARRGGGEALHILHDPAQAILQHPLAACGTMQPVIIGQFDPFLPTIIDIGKADHMSSHLPGRVITLILALQKNPGDVKGHHLLSEIRVDMAPQIDKFTLRTGHDALFQINGIHIQQAGQLWPLSTSHDGSLWIGPNGIHRRADRQRLTVAIANHPAVRRYGHRTQMAGVTLILQEILIDHLEIDRPPHQGSHRQAQTQQDNH